MSIVIAAAVCASLIFALQPTVKANSTSNNNISQDVSQPTLSSVNATNNNSTCTVPFNGFMGFGGPRGMFGGYRDRGIGPEGFGGIQISSDYTANVTSIAKSDSDVQNLLSQGYNITSIRPVITTSIDGNGK